MKDLKLSSDHLIKLLSLMEKQEISVAQGRKILEVIIMSDEDPVSVQEKLGLKQNSNEDEIKVMCEEVIDSNPQSIIDYKNGKEKMDDFIRGTIMFILLSMLSYISNC